MLKKRFPPLAAIVPVYAVISALFYGWSIMVFIWKLPAWLFFLTMGEIAGIFAYQFVTNLIESLFILGVLLVLAFLLPARILRNDFMVRGSAAAFTWIAMMMLFLHRFVNADRAYDEFISYGPPSGASLIWWMMGAILLAVLVAFLASRFQTFGKVVAWVADRFIIFLFLLLPLSLISILVVIFRLLA